MESQSLQAEADVSQARKAFPTRSALVCVCSDVLGVARGSVECVLANFITA